MKNLTNVLPVMGILLIIYAAIVKLTGQPTMSFGIVEIRAATGLVAANSLILMYILTKLSSK